MFVFTFTKMFHFIYIAILINSVVLSANVREFPFDVFNETENEENVTAREELTTMSNLVTQMVEDLIHLEEEINETIPNILPGNASWNNEASPIFSALRSFWVQAKAGLLEPIDPQTGEPVHESADHVIKALEHGLIEATTMLMTRMEDTTLSAMQEEKEQLQTEPTPVVKRKGEVMKEPESNANGKEGSKHKRKTAFDLLANMSSSCSNCYDKLQTCVQKCFSEHNCNDIQRGVRTCPPVPSRLCNFFTQWNPVDECNDHSDCKSPLLCCNDGCMNKCQQGVWNS